MPQCPKCRSDLPAGVTVCPRDGTRIGPVDGMVGKLFGKYRVLGRFPGDPSPGLYRANQVDLDREVGLRILNADDESHGKRFIREARALAAVSHPNIVHVFDFGRTTTGMLYMATEPLAGVPMDRYLEEEGPLVERRAIRIARSIAEGLGAAHTSGIIHRDLKPSNLFISGSPASPGVTIYNFSIAKVQRRSTTDGETKTGLTVNRVVLGSPWYASPEQAMDEDVDPRSDLYSLGCILFEMLFGHPPFRGRSAVEILSKHVREDVQLPTLTGAPLHEGVEALVLQLLSKDPGARPPSAEAVVQEIYRIDRDLAGGTMITGRPQRLDEPAPPPLPEGGVPTANIRRPADDTRETAVGGDDETFLDPAAHDLTHPVETPAQPRRIVVGGKRVRKPGARARDRREETKVIKGGVAREAPTQERMTRLPLEAPEGENRIDPQCHHPWAAGAHARGGRDHRAFPRPRDHGHQSTAAGL